MKKFLFTTMIFMGISVMVSAQEKTSEKSSQKETEKAKVQNAEEQKIRAEKELAQKREMERMEVKEKSVDQIDAEARDRAKAKGEKAATSEEKKAAEKKITPASVVLENGEDNTRQATEKAALDGTANAAEVKPAEKETPVSRKPVAERKSTKKKGANN